MYNTTHFWKANGMFLVRVRRSASDEMVKFSDASHAWRMVGAMMGKLSKSRHAHPRLSQMGWHQNMTIPVNRLKSLRQIKFLDISMTLRFAVMKSMT
jgi:hypothetical protein